MDEVSYPFWRERFWIEPRTWVCQSNRTTGSSSDRSHSAAFQYSGSVVAIHQYSTPTVVYLIVQLWSAIVERSGTLDWQCPIRTRVARLAAHDTFGAAIEPGLIFRHRSISRPASIWSPSSVSVKTIETARGHSQLSWTR